MICGCCKDLGCFAYGQDIDFQIKSLGDASDYIFHIWSNGGYSTVNQSFANGVVLTIPFLFNENSETSIKIEIPGAYKDPEYGVSYVTTADGACCFTVHGLVSTCS